MRLAKFRSLTPKQQKIETKKAIGRIAKARKKMDETGTWGGRNVLPNPPLRESLVAIGTLDWRYWHKQDRERQCIPFLFSPTPFYFLG